MPTLDVSFFPLGDKSLAKCDKRNQNLKCHEFPQRGRVLYDLTSLKTSEIEGEARIHEKAQRR